MRSNSHRCWILTLAGTWLAASISHGDQNDPRLDSLFESLRDRGGHVLAVEREIWEIWSLSGDPQIDRHMELGTLAIRDGLYGEALHHFDAVTENKPGFAEGWNKRATVYWLVGAHEQSRVDVDRTLSLEPRHFGALSGLALIHHAQQRPGEALRALERCEAVHPHMPGLKGRIEELRRIAGTPI
ncbi:hypothetical protein MK489_11570 [Myxococcota bacterium]|nr:hypothetical protein [Myxococcota bacterium]